MVMAMKRTLGSGYRWLDVGMQMFRGLFTSAHSYMIFFVTARCNARCEFCFYWEEIESAASRRELKLEEIDKITKKLKHLLYLSIGGGEPFLRKDLADIVSLFYCNSKTRIVNITTNGLQPARTEALVERMLEENPNLFLKVGISLDALGDKHDEMRKVPGTFAKVRETHDRLRDLRERQRFFGINIATTFSKFNEDEIDQVIDYVDSELDVNDHTMTFIRGDAKDRSALDASLAKYKWAVDYLEAKHRPQSPMFRILHNVLRMMFRINIETLEQDKMIVPCVAGSKMVTLDDQGQIKPCEMLEHIQETDRFGLGNVRDYDYDIPVLMRSAKACGVRKWIRDTECHCTFECANMANVVFNYRTWPKVVVEYFRKPKMEAPQQPVSQSALHQITYVD